MVGFFLRRRRAGLGVVLISLVCFLQLRPARADITYDILDFAASENGWQISGTITTDGTLGDDLTGTNIVSWNWMASNGGPPFYLDSSLPNQIEPRVPNNHFIFATPQSLSVLDAGTMLTLGDHPPGQPAEFLRWQNTGAINQMTIELQLSGESPQFWQVPTTTFTFAEIPNRSPSTPEPSTLVLFSGFGALSMLVAWRKRSSNRRA